MSINRSDDELVSLVHELCKLPHETEWVEFKENNAKPADIGQYISALANSAILQGKVFAYIIWGITNDTHKIVGTDFSPKSARNGNEELESWLLRLLTPKINFRFFEFNIEGVHLALLEIDAMARQPIQFEKEAYIRVGSYTKKLKEFPEKERELWRIFDHVPFERSVAAANITSDDVYHLLDYESYFNVLKLPFPQTRQAVLEALATDQIVQRQANGRWNIFNLGAILFGRKLSDFSSLKRKTVRVIIYNQNSRTETVRELEYIRGYACQFETLINDLINILPSNEVIGQALRKKVSMFPALAIRELIANCLIHQDFHQTGTGPMIEIFSNFIEITNPGLPLVKTDRFLDTPPKSRNEGLASFMRRIGVCEERGSGIDKVVSQTELYQLPAPIFEITDEHTRVVLFAHRQLKNMDEGDRIRACYLHACLKYVERDYMTNASLRNRFGIEEKNSATASRIIRATVIAKKIKAYDAGAAKKMMKYIPYWA